jgi:hypothetical protein
MMVDILPHIVQVVVLAPGSNTLLRVHYPMKNREGSILENGCIYGMQMPNTKILHLFN